MEVSHLSKELVCLAIPGLKRGVTGVADTFGSSRGATGPKTLHLHGALPCLQQQCSSAATSAQTHAIQDKRISARAQSRRLCDVRTSDRF